MKSSLCGGRILISQFLLLITCSLIPALIAPTCVLGADISTFSSAGCAFPDTNQSRSYTATFGEDHDYASSISTMSFTVYRVGIASVTVDDRTGLMWVTNPSADAGFTGQQTWESALTSCTVTLNGMAYAGYTDWRLPNVRELMSIYQWGWWPGYSAAFVFSWSYYWTSTTYATDSLNAWFVYSGGLVGVAGKANNNFSVRCVRGGP